MDFTESGMRWCAVVSTDVRWQLELNGVDLVVLGQVDNILLKSRGNAFPRKRLTEIKTVTSVFGGIEPTVWTRRTLEKWKWAAKMKQV